MGAGSESVKSVKSVSQSVKRTRMPSATGSDPGRQHSRISDKRLPDDDAKQVGGASVSIYPGTE